MTEKLKREIALINKALQLKPINKPIRYLVMWRPGDPPATKKGEVWTLEKEEQARPTKCH